MINFKKAQYITSSASPKDAPKDGLPFILFIGRSNVGKSTLINALTGMKSLAFASKKAGKTKALNYFLIDDSFYLVDAPGYGSTNFATMSTVQFSKMMEEVVLEKRLKGIVLLMDLRRDPGKDDIAFYHYLVGTRVPLLPVLTKADQMNQKEKASAKKRAEGLGLTNPIFSDLGGESATKVRFEIAKILGK